MARRMGATPVATLHSADRAHDPGDRAPRFKRHPLHDKNQTVARVIVRLSRMGGSCVSSESTSSDERSQIVDPCAQHADGTRSTRRVDPRPPRHRLSSVQQYKTVPYCLAEL